MKYDKIELISTMLTNQGLGLILLTQIRLYLHHQQQKIKQKHSERNQLQSFFTKFNTFLFIVNWHCTRIKQYTFGMSAGWEDKLLAYLLHLKLIFCAQPEEAIGRIMCFGLHELTVLMILWGNRGRSGGLIDFFITKQTSQVSLHKTLSSFPIKVSFKIEDMNNIKSSKQG